MKVNIRKISELTGFSPATVSNALNRKRGVNKDTAELIWKKAEELGYLSVAKVTKIKFVSFKGNGRIIEDSPFFPAVMEGVERAAKAQGYETLFVHLEKGKPDFEEQLKEILEDTSAGVILLGTEMMEEDFIRFQNHQCPLILLDGWSDTVPFDAVLINNTDSAYRATKLLIQRGHKRIGYLKADFRIKAFKYRDIGYQRAIGEQKLQRDPKHIITLGTTMETAYRDMKRHLEREKDLPTAFFADDDVIALGAIRAMQEQGIRVPEDVSVIGFDDLPFCEISSPRLSTIHVYKQEMGELAVSRLIESMQSKGRIKTKIQVCTEFVERDSIASRVPEETEK